MKRIIERYKYESDLQLEEKVNLRLMGDLGQELILQRKFNDETAACVYIMNYNDFKSINIDKLFHVSVSEINSKETVVLNISIALDQWRALYEARIVINKWVIDAANNCIINIQDGRQLRIPKYCAGLWQHDDDAYNQNIINERLIRYVVAKDILKRNRRNKTI